MATTDVAFFFFHLSCSKEHETHLTTTPCPCPEQLQAIHETVWPSWTHQSLLQGLLQSLSLALSFAPLRPFCPPAAGASCDPGPLSCTHGGNEGCWAVCGFAGESLGGLKCVCVTAVLYVVLSQMVKRSFLSTYSCCCLRATFPLSEFVLLWLFMPKSCQAASSAVNNLLLGSHRASLHISFL